MGLLGVYIPRTRQWHRQSSKERRCLLSRYPQCLLQPTMEMMMMMMVVMMRYCNDDGMKTIAIMRMIVILVLSGYVSISNDTSVSVDICDDHLGSEYIY